MLASAYVRVSMIEHETLLIDERLHEFMCLLEGVAHDPNPDVIHALRVASRKLDVWLMLGNAWVLRSDLKWLRNLAGRERDADVVLVDAALPPQFREWLEADRDEGRSQLLIACSSDRARGLVRALQMFASLPRCAALRNLRNLARRVLKAGAVREQAEQTIETTHRLRRRLKALRYALEWLHLPKAYLKDMQDSLGAVNDIAVALDLLSRSGMAEAQVELHSQLEDELQLRVRMAWSSWESCAVRLSKDMELWTSS